MTSTAKSLSSFRFVSKRYFLLPGLLLGGGILVFAFLWSIGKGAAEIDRQVVYDALVHHDDTNFSHLIIQLVRLPRVLSGMIVGASLAVAGALMQGLTRNPLADPGLLGITSGATFAVVMSLYLLDDPSLSNYALFAFIGSATAGAIVYGLGSMGRGGSTPLKLTLAGVIVSAFISSFTAAILVTDQQTLDQIRFWMAGSLAGREMPLFRQTAPYMLFGLGMALVLARQITTISLGEDVARGLGQNTVWVKGLAAVAITLLAGGAVALAGPIGFVGLIVPHLARMLVGADYRWIIPYSALMGALLVIVADVYARILIKPQEIPVGVMLALIGTPFFIYLARWRVK
jgi:iron complex transport system permease protein